MSSALAAAAKIREWREQPVVFVREVLGLEPDAWQADVLNACVFKDKPGRRVAMKASKGPGKSGVLAMIGWWYLVTRPHPKVAATSITGDNLKDNLWAELAKWQKRSKLLKAKFAWSAERIVMKEHPETWWASARTWSKSASPTDQADTLAGLHADHLAFLVDESGGIPDAVMAAAEAGLANVSVEEGREALLVQAGNPTETSGPLWRACTSERPLWTVIEISGDPDDPKRAPRVSIEWAREQIAKYGKDNAWVLVNVYGKFPPGQSNTLIGVDTASVAGKRTLEPSVYINEPKILGLDVARFGEDETVFAPRQGRLCYRLKTLRSRDTMEVTGHLVRAIERWNPDAVFIDADGVGAGVIDRAIELGYPVIGIHSGGKPFRNDPACLNHRAEMWWTMGDWLKGASIPDDAELIKQLAGPTFKYDSAGKLVLEKKDDMKKRGLSSPDRADALALTFAQPVARKSAAERVGLKKERGAVQDFDPYSGPRDFDPYGDDRS